MRYLISLLSSLFLFLSCNDSKENNLTHEKTKQIQDSVFTTISKNWAFVFPKANPEIENVLSSWKEWHQFQNELEQKPKTSLLAFQMKIENVSSRSDSLYLSIPERFNNPQVRSRMITLSTQLNSLNTYMHLQHIPQKKVNQLIKTVNEEINSVYSQMEEVVIKERIPMEIGEETMIRALDTTRLANAKSFEENLLKTDSIENNTSNKLLPSRKKVLPKKSLPSQLKSE